MVVKVVSGTPLAERLQGAVQSKLGEVGWSTGDDQSLSEYIILMLVNGKTQQQIADDLAVDLLGLEPQDPSVLEFTRWLFEQAEVTKKELSGGTAQPAVVSADMQTSTDKEMNTNTFEDVQDAEMSDAGDNVQDPAVPTGPRSMRNGTQKTRDKRMFGQLNKAMDRKSDATLHRVKGTATTGRIDSRAVREIPKGPVPKGPRAALSRMPNGASVVRPSMTNAPQRMQAGVPPASGLQNSAFMSMTPQQQMQIYAMYEEQARMMAQILSPQQQSQMLQGVANPAFAQGNPQQQTGPSLFDRIHEKPGKIPQVGGMNKRQPAKSTAVKPSPLDVELPGNRPDPAAMVCRFNLSCNNASCPYVHQSPAAPPGIAIDLTDTCSYGVACKNRKCVGKHPSPAKKTQHAAEVVCKFFPHCANPNCPFRHPSEVPCPNGPDCTLPDCKLYHNKEAPACRYNPCLNPECRFRHMDGQKRGNFEDKVWVNKDSERKPGKNGYISERKFVNDAGDEELILPGQSSPDAAAGEGIIT